MGGFVDTRYADLRGELDKYGFGEMLSYDSIDLVLQLFTDWKQKSIALSKVTREAEYFSRIAEELEEGVAPFKEENVRLIKENSQLRLGILHAQEKAEETVLGSKSRIQDLESENDDLKLLVKQFVSRTKSLEFESLEKSNKIGLLLERNSESSSVNSDGKKKRNTIKKQKMDLKNPAQFVCPHCVRIRNYVEYGKKYKDPTIFDFAKMSDSRIEALQIQNRNLKTNQNELNEAISLLMKKIAGRELEIDKLKGVIEVRPGRVTSAGTDKDGENGFDRDLHLALKAAQMQLDILQSRNLQLEKKLQTSILQEHSKFMNNAKLSKGMNRDLLESYVDLEAAGYPTHDKMTLEEKVRLLEAQLSHCCKDKAKLKLLLEECENRHKRRPTTPVRSTRSRRIEGTDRCYGNKSIKSILPAPGRGHAGKFDKSSRKDGTSILNNVSHFFEDSGTELSEYEDYDADADAVSQRRSRIQQRSANGVVKSAKSRIPRSSSTGPAASRPPWRAGVSNNRSRPSSAHSEGGESREKLTKSHSQKRFSSVLDKVARGITQKPSVEKVSSTSIGRKSSLKKEGSSQESKTLKFQESKERTNPSERENQDRFSNSEQSSDYTENDEDEPEDRSRTKSSASSRPQTAPEQFQDTKRFSSVLDKVARGITQKPSVEKVSSTSIGSKSSVRKQSSSQQSKTLKSKESKETTNVSERENHYRFSNSEQSSDFTDNDEDGPEVRSRAKSSAASRPQTAPEQLHGSKSGHEKGLTSKNNGDEDLDWIRVSKKRSSDGIDRLISDHVTAGRRRTLKDEFSNEDQIEAQIKRSRKLSRPPQDSRSDGHEYGTKSNAAGHVLRTPQVSSRLSNYQLDRRTSDRRSQVESAPVSVDDEERQTATDSESGENLKNKQNERGQMEASGSTKTRQERGSKSRTTAPESEIISDEDISEADAINLPQMSRKTSAELQSQHGHRLESLEPKPRLESRKSSKGESRQLSPEKSKSHYKDKIRREEEGTNESKSKSSQRQVQDSTSPTRKTSRQSSSKPQSRQDQPRTSGPPLNESNEEDFSESDVGADTLPQMSRTTSGELQSQHGRRLESLEPNPRIEESRKSSKGESRQLSPEKSKSQIQQNNVSRDDARESRSGSSKPQVQDSASTGPTRKTSSKNLSKDQSSQDFPGRSRPSLDESSQTRPPPIHETKEVVISDEVPKGVKRKPGESKRSMLESLPSFPGLTGSQAVPFEEPVEPHRLTRQESDALQGVHGRRLNDEYDQFNIETENIPFQFPVTRSKGKGILRGTSSTESNLLHAYGVDRSKTQNPTGNRDPWDVLSDKQENLRMPYDKFEVSPPRGMFSSEDDRDRIRDILPGRSATRTILSGDASPLLFAGRGPGQSEWITLNSDVEAYRREIERLRNLTLRKEDEADELAKEKEVLERRMKTMQSELSARREDTPYAFQAAMKRLEEERDFLQNNLRTSQNRTRELERQVSNLQGVNEETRSLQTRLRESEMTLERAKLDLKEGDTQRLNLEKQIRQLTKDLSESQGDAQRWRQEAQRTRDGLEETERLLSEVQRRQTAALAVPQRDSYDLTQQYQRLASREQSLEREIVTLKSGLKALDRDKDDMRVELDRKDERLAKYQSETEQYKIDISNLLLRLKNAELQLSHTGETNREQERETIIFRRQTESLRRDLELVMKERDDCLSELRKITKTHSLSEVERRSMSSELDKRNKETDDLKKQLQKYIDEVRRIEDLLMRKEEEYDLIFDQYRALTAEHSSLESQRNSLEIEADTIRREVRETAGQNATLKSKITTQSSLCASYEEEIERLSLQIAALETQLNSVSSAEKTLQNESTSTRDLCLKLEANLDKTRLELANSTSAQNKLDAENKQLRAQVESMDAELAIQTQNYNRLEELISKTREKEFSIQRSIQELTVERDEQSRTASSLNIRTESLSQEVSKYRLRCTELQAELDRARRQLLNEMSERETAVAELRKLQDQLNTSSTNFLLGSSTFTSRDSRSVSPSPRASGRSEMTRLRTTDPGQHETSPLAAMQSLSRSFSPDPDLQSSTPLGTSTARTDDPSKDQRSPHD